MQNVIDTVPQLVNDYIEKHSKSQLSRNTGINPRTLDRIADGDIELEDFKYPEKVIHLINEVGASKSFEEAFLVAPDKIKKRLRNGVDISPSSVNKKPFVHSENSGIEQLLNNEAKRLVVFLLALNSSGTDLEQVINITGEEGTHELALLLEQGILRVKNNRIFTSLPHNRFYFSRRFIKNNASTLISYYSTRRANKQHNYILWQTRSLNRSAIKKIQSLADEFHNKVFDIVDSTNSQGKIPYFLVLAMDSFNDIHFH